jgi:hypothetical protein
VSLLLQTDYVIQKEARNVSAHHPRNTAHPDAGLAAAEVSNANRVCQARSSVYV